MSWKIVCGVLLVVIFAVTASAASDIQQSNTEVMRAIDIQKRADGIRFGLEIAAPEIADVPVGDSWGQVLEIPGAGMIQEEGFPTVPRLSRMFRMPPTGGAQAVILNAEYETMTGLEYAAYMGMNGEEYVFGELDETVDEWYPGTIAEVTDAAIARQFRIANLVTYPVQVNAFLDEVRVYSGLEVDVQYGGEGVNELSSYPTALSSSYLSFYESFLDWDTDELDDFEIYHGAVQVVARETAITQLAEWIEWKRQKGYKLELLTDSMVSWTSGAIKIELQNRWDNSQYKFDWVVIVGDDNGSYATPPGHGIGDHYYVKLAGGDEFPEAGVGRISVDDQGDLNAYENKVILYERDPYMGDTGWYQRGVVGAGSSYSGISTIYLGRYARHAMLDIGYTQVDTAWYNDGGGSVNNRNIQSVENGVSFFSYRGYVGTGLGNSEILNLNNDFMLPMVITITCGEGDWVGGDDKSESWMSAGTANVPTGGIGCIATGTLSTHTRYNNCLSGGGIFSNLVLRNKEMGAVIFWTKVNLYNSYYPWASGSVASFSEWTNMMGDPSVWLWTDIPRPLEVTHPASIEYGRHGYEVVVTDDLGIPEADAWVCLYKSDAEDDTVAFGVTDADGRIVLDPPFEGLGLAKLTVTKQNHHPYQADILCEVNTLMAVTNVQIIDNGMGGSAGDGDGLAEPGEIVGLWITLHNMYGFNAPRVGAVFNADDPMVEATGGVAQFGNIQSGERKSATSLALIQIADDAQSGWIVDGSIGLGIIPQGGSQPNVVQEDLFTFKINAPEYTYVTHDVTGTIIPGATVDVNFDVANIGLSDGPASQIELVSLDTYIVVNSGPGTLPATQVGGVSTTSDISITAHPSAFKGYPAKAELHISNAAGHLDTVSVTIPLGTRDSTDPVGPDEYGYVAFDNRDTGYDIAPEYDWIEINPDAPNNDYTGIELDIHDSGEEDDDADVVDLPFNVQFYGADFSEMTVTCNGFVSMGHQLDMRTPRNWPIPSPLGPNYMIAPYWDDRRESGANSGVFQYYDEPNGRYIVEWYSVADIFNTAPNTFQLIIYDQVGENVTISGDANILFQYEDVTHTGGDGSDNPYMTVGVENGDQTDGLQVSYWDSDDGPTADITNGRAILITTMVSLASGTVSGNVTYQTGGDPVEDATVRTSDWQYFTTTNADGDYNLVGVITGPHEIIVEMVGINSVSGEVEVIEDETVILDFTVTAPEFAMDVAEIDVALPPDGSIVIPVVISNDGDGWLTWAVEVDRDGPGAVADELWNLDDTFPLFDGESSHRGVTFYKGFYWLAGSNNGSNPNGLYRLDIEGTHIQSYAQPVPNPSSYGFSGITTDGEYLYGTDNNILYEMYYDDVSQDLTLTSEVPLPDVVGSSPYLTYDSDNDIFWMGKVDSPMYAVSRAGSIMQLYNTGMNILANSYFGEDPDGYDLYLALQLTMSDDLSIIKMDPLTGDTMFVAALPVDGYRVKDIHLTYHMDPFFWSLIVLENAFAVEDRIEVYEFTPHTGWMSLSRSGGDILPGETIDLDISIASLDVPEGVYSSWLRFTNNSITPEVFMPVTVTVDEGAATLAVHEDQIAQPLEWTFNGVYPNPFNPTASVSFTMKEAANAKAMLFNVLGQRVAVLLDGELKAGHHQLTINGANLASGVYFLRFQAGPLQETRKIVLMR